MAIGVYMEYGNLIIQFPVNPEEISFKTSGNNETIEVVKLGEVNIAKDMKLSTIEFESFLPLNNVYPFILTKNKFKKPKFYIDFINKVRVDKKPIRFIVSDTNINILALIEDFQYTYKAADDDTHFSISLKEYREIKVKTITISNNTSSRPVQKTESLRAAPINKNVTTGCSVIVNGTLHRDSYGSGPGMTLKDYKGKVNFVVDDGRGYPYHVTNTSGGYMGWVKKSCVKVI